MRNGRLADFLAQASEDNIHEDGSWTPKPHRRPEVRESSHSGHSLRGRKPKPTSPFAEDAKKAYEGVIFHGTTWTHSFVLPVREISQISKARREPVTTAEIKMLVRITEEHVQRIGGLRHTIVEVPILLVEHGRKLHNGVPLAHVLDECEWERRHVPCNFREDMRDWQRYKGKGGRKFDKSKGKRSRSS